MTHRPDLLVSTTWLIITLWCVAGSVAIVLGLAWLIAQAAEWVVSIGMMVVS